MRRTLLVSTVLLLPLVACATTTVDVFSRFRIQGIVVNEDEKPLEDVEIFFLDLSLDQWVAGSEEPILLGGTDSNGYFSGLFPYTWGYIARESRSDASILENRKFQIILKKEGFNTVTLDFKITETATADWETIVELGTVMMFRDLEQRWPEDSGHPSESALHQLLWNAPKVRCYPTLGLREAAQGVVEP